jgi:hypothetical protein
MRIRELGTAMVFVCGTLAAQTTWSVGNGMPGMNFPTLAIALASPSVVDGDTLVFHSWSGFGAAANGFTTNKGVTIVGATAMELAVTSPAQPFEVNGLPAGRTFRMSGFFRAGAGNLDIRVVNCAGAVHLERIWAPEHAAFFPTAPAIVVDNCASVTLRHVENHGTPALSCIASRVALTSCRLGISSLGLGGGGALHATNSIVDIVQPNFDPGWAAGAVVGNGTTFRIAGDATSRIAGGAGIPVFASGGAVFVDPAVAMPMTVPGAPIGGTATVVVGTVPATWVQLPTSSPTFPGQMAIRARAAAGSVVFQALGTPGPLAGSPLGTLGIDPLQWYAFLAPAVVPASGTASLALPVPALPPGTAFATQSLVVSATSLELGLPATFVVF